MKKEKELQEAFMKLMHLASELGISIREVTIAGFWFSDYTEVAPAKLLGIDITNNNPEKF